MALPSVGASTGGALSCVLPPYLRQDGPLLRTVVLDSCILSRGAGWGREGALNTRTLGGLSHQCSSTDNGGTGV